MIEKRIEAEMLKKLNSLEKSKFRGAFHLNKKMKEYVNIKGLDKIRKDTYDFINSRLAPAVPKNDGKQTPMRQVHPTFIAMHANGFCCRNCLNRIHHIEKNRNLTNDEIDYIVEFIMLWIQKEINNRI
jgi:hypothetical protein